jgi:hypothetical protein
MTRRDTGFPFTMDMIRMGKRKIRPVKKRNGKKWIIKKPIFSG